MFEPVSKEGMQLFFYLASLGVFSSMFVCGGVYLLIDAFINRPSKRRRW